MDPILGGGALKVDGSNGRVTGDTMGEDKVQSRAAGESLSSPGGGGWGLGGGC